MVSSAPAAYRFLPDVVMRDLEGGLVVVNLATGGTWKVNATGAEICRAVERGAPVEEMSEALVKRFGVAADVAARDVERLLGELVGQGLLTPARG